MYLTHSIKGISGLTSCYIKSLFFFFFYWCITFLRLGWQKLQGGLWGAGLGKTEHHVMRYLSSDNVNDQKRDEVGTKASPAGKLSNSWSPGTDSSVAAGCPCLPKKLITADKCIKRHHLDLFPTEAGGKIPMSCSYPPSNLCREAQMCSQQPRCHVRISVPSPVDFPSGACAENPEDPCPTLRTLPSLPPHRAERPPGIWARFGQSCGPLLLSLQIQNLIYSVYTADDGVVTAQRTLLSAFPGVQQITFAAVKLC